MNNSSKNCVYVFDDDLGKNASLLMLLGVFVICFFFITISNAMLIHGLRKTNKVLSLTKRLFIYLSSTDLFTGFVTLPVQITSLVLSKNAPCWLVGVQAFVNAFTISLAMFTLLSISITRFVSVTRSTFYKKYARRKYVVGVLIIQAVVALALTAWYVIATQLSEQHLGVFLTSVTLLCAGTIGTSVVLNVRLFFYLKKHQQSNPFLKEHQRFNEYHMEVTRTLLIICVLLLACYLPCGIMYGVFGYYMIIGKHEAMIYHIYVPWLHMLMILNAGLNASVYMLRNKKIIKYYKLLLCQRKTEESNLPVVIPTVHLQVEMILAGNSSDCHSVTTLT